MRRIITVTGVALAGTVLLVGCGNATETASGNGTKTETSVATEPSVVDTDGDRITDENDAFPADRTEWSEENGNKIGDNQDAAAEAEAAEAQDKAEARRKIRARVAKAKSPSEREWAQVVKSPDAHIGDFYVVYGQIWQFDAATGSDAFLATTASSNTMSYGYFEGDDAMFTGSTSRFADLVEDDVFRATVEVVEAYSYDTQIGGNTTVPLLQVHRITREN